MNTSLIHLPEHKQADQGDQGHDHKIRRSREGDFVWFTWYWKVGSEVSSLWQEQRLLTAINYDYDATGNLVKDRSEGIDQISWTVYGKIWEIQKQRAESAIKYRYDASGNRVYIEGADGTKTFYVRDATGNTMAIYEKTGTGSLVLKEQELYGSSRLGTYQRNVEVESLEKVRIFGEAGSLNCRIIWVTYWQRSKIG